jgi:hypothetical protein
MFTKKFLAKFLLVVVVSVCLPNLAQGADSFGICGVKKLNKPKRLRTACQMVTDADIGWCRASIFWKHVVDNEGNFDWEDMDNRIRTILNHEIEIIITLRSIHELFAPGSGWIDIGDKMVWRSAPPAPEYLEHYREFVRQAVERYDADEYSDADFVVWKKKVKHWQVENEPGKKAHKGSIFWNGTAADYADHYLVTYDAIKEVDPGAKVALSGFTYGAVTWALTNPGNSFPLEVLRILDETEGDFDIFDFHFYRDYRDFHKAWQGVKFLLNSYSQFSAKPLWVTEVNVNKHDMDPYFTIEEYNRFVAKDIVKRYSVLLSRGIKKVFWYQFYDQNHGTWNIPMEPNDFEAFRGLTENSLTPKPVYYTYKLLIEKIQDKQLRQRQVALESLEGIRIYQFGRQDNVVYVMWYDSPLGEPTEAFIPLPWEQVLVTHVITEPGVTEPETEVKSTVDGVLEITLDDSPIFVEEYQVQP